MLRPILLFATVWAAGVALDLACAGARLAHPVPDLRWPATLAAARWGLLAVLPVGLAAWLRARRGGPALGPAVAGLWASAAAAMASVRVRGALPPEDAAGVLLEVIPVLGAGALGVALAGRAPRAAPALALLLWLGLAVPGVRWAAGPGGLAAAGAPDVVLLTLDTFREDALSASPRALVPGLTPRLDAVAAAGCRVDGALSPAPLTGPAHGALLTGRTPPELGILLNGRPVDPTAPRLAGRFAAAGYRTGAFVSSAMVAGGLGYAQGFAAFDDDLGGEALWEASSTARLRLPMSRRRLRRARFDRPGEATVGRLAAWLQRDPGPPVFVWLHLYDAHTPYRPGPTGEAAVAAVDPGAVLPAPGAYAHHPAVPGLGVTDRILRRLQAGGQDRAVAGPDAPAPGGDPDSAAGDARGWRHARAYLAGVAHADRVVGAALDALEAARGGRPRVLVVVGDHGESLTEHNELASHQQHLYRANLGVPLILPAGGPCPGGPVSTLGVGHALLGAAGLPTDGFPSFGAAPISAWLRGQAHAPDDPTVRVDKAAVTVGPHRAIGGRDRAWIEAYDLSVDPHELHPLPAVPAAAAAALGAALDALEASAPVALDDETRAALEALGYLGE